MGEKTLFISIAIGQFFVWIITTFIEVIKNMFSYYFKSVKKIKTSPYSNFVVTLLPCIFMIIIVIIYSSIDDSLNKWAEKKNDTLILCVTSYIILFSIIVTISGLKLGIDIYHLKCNQ